MVDVNRVPPPPGWYDDPWPGDGVRWWDGARWTEHTQRADRVPVPGPVPGGRRQLRKGWFTLSIWLQVVLWVSAALSAAELGGASWLLVLARRWHSDPSTYDGAASDNSTGLVNAMLVLRMLVLVAGAVLFICWLYQAHRSDRMDIERLRHGSAWAIWSWFVPVLWFWYPLAMVIDTTNGASRDGRRRGSQALRVSWWVVFVMTEVADITGFFIDPEDYGRGDRGYYAHLRNWAISSMIASALCVLCAVLGVFVVRQVTRLVREVEPLAPRPVLPAPAGTLDAAAVDYPGTYLDGDPGTDAGTKRPVW